jgi:ketosteroid isomerase-like protein
VTENAFNPEATQLLFQKYVNEGNLGELISLYDQNAVVIEKEGTIKQGGQNIHEHLKKLLALEPTIENTVLQTIVVKDTAMVFSKWSLKGVAPNGDLVNASGQSFDVLSRQGDGTWLITIDSPYGNRPEIA